MHFYHRIFKNMILIDSLCFSDKNELKHDIIRATINKVNDLPHAVRVIPYGIIGGVTVAEVAASWLATRQGHLSLFQFKGGGRRLSFVSANAQRRSSENNFWITFPVDVLITLTVEHCMLYAKSERKVSKSRGRWNCCLLRCKYILFIRLGIQWFLYKLMILCLTSL